MTLLWNNLDIAFLCHKQNLTTVLFTCVYVYVCVCVSLLIPYSGCVWGGKADRRKNGGRTWKRKLSYPQRWTERVDGLALGGGSGNGCKMHNSAVTTGDEPPPKKRNKDGERSGDRKEWGRCEGCKTEEEEGRVKEERKVRGREGRCADRQKGMGATWQVLYHLLRHCWAARKQSLGFSREQPSP